MTPKDIYLSIVVVAVSTVGLVFLSALAPDIVVRVLLGVSLALHLMMGLWLWSVDYDQKRLNKYIQGIR